MSTPDLEKLANEWVVKDIDGYSWIQTIDNELPRQLTAAIGTSEDVFAFLETVCEAHNAALQRAIAEKDEMWTRASEQAETLAEYLVDAKAEVAVLTDQHTALQRAVEKLAEDNLRLRNSLDALESIRQGENRAFTAQLAAAKEDRDFYKRRCDNLQLVQSKMRDPERKWVCDILANGYTPA